LRRHDRSAGRDRRRQHGRARRPGRLRRRRRPGPPAPRGGPGVTIKPTKIADAAAHEGPVYVAEEHALYYTTLPRHFVVDIERLDLSTGAVSTVRADANMANGMTLAPDGRLLVCEQGKNGTPARISAVDRVTGVAEAVVEDDLNSPNDVVVARDGSIWF